MANLVDAIQQLGECLESDLPDGFSIGQIEYPNSPTFQNSNNDKWIRCTWNNLGILSRDANGCYEITEGILTIDIFYPKGSGDIDAIRDAEHIKNTFQNYIFDDVIIDNVVVTPIPPVVDWYCVRVEMVYQYEGYVS